MQHSVAWSNELTASTNIAGTLQHGGEGGRVDGVTTLQTAVRRLTPRECERLQGFPDDYTLVEYRGKLAADGPRYKALGNSMAVPVMRWLGQRIAAVDEILRNRHQIERVS
jgi:DNA (cytosine-5)-methyltransferase 1